MRQIVLRQDFGIANLTERSVEKPSPKSDEILVRMRAAALNYVDLAIVEGALDRDLPLPLIPVADGAGTIEEIGADIRGFDRGDLVSTLYIPAWQSGRYRAEYTTPGIRPGTGFVAGQLCEYKVFKPHEIVKAPKQLSAFEAATLPIAALSAWNALVYANVKPGHTILIHGTGGVSLFVLQFAKLFGASAIVTSSSDDKLERAKALGADVTINYRTSPSTVDDVLTATNHEGVDVVVETVGGSNLSQSIDALRPEGHVSLVGFLAGVTASVNLIAMNLKRATLTGVSVGSTEDFESMLAAISKHNLKPVIDSVYPLE